MKQFFYLLSFVIIISSCTSAKKHMNRGEYDLAINKSVKKLQKNRNKEKQILILERSYKKANEEDMARINSMKMEGIPDIWDQIFFIYKGMNKRQNKIKPLLPLKVKSQNREANLPIVNYDEEMVNAKQKAAEYFYIHAQTLLDRGDKESARKAYYELKQVKSFYSDYKDVDQLIAKAQQAGISYVSFKMQNQTRMIIPEDFEKELMKISLTSLNGEWIIYHTNIISGINYDYSILVNLKMIDVTPEAVKEIHYTETKEVQDGFQYALDNKGNVKKDSSGNDIKMPKYKTISCSVIENYQHKSARISGTLDYINNHSGQLIKTSPITADAIFENRAATAVGDVNALKKETKDKLGNRPMPFPNDASMIMQAGNTLKGMISNIIYSNDRILY